MVTKQIKYILFIFILVLFMITEVMAVPNLINYQGRLTDNSGNPITGSTVVVFSFYDAESGGSLLGSFEDSDSVTPDANGVFSTLIGDDPGNFIPAAVFTADSVYLNVNVASEDLSPRKRVTASAFAFNAGDLNCTGCVDASELSDSLKVSFHARKSESQSIPYYTPTKILFDLEVYDDGSNFDPSSGTFTVPVDGVYHFDVHVVMSGISQMGFYLELRLNGSSEAMLFFTTVDSDNKAGGGVTRKLAAGDMVDIYVSHTDTSLPIYVITDYDYTWFTGYRVY